MVAHKVVGSVWVRGGQKVGRSSSGGGGGRSRCGVADDGRSDGRLVSGEGARREPVDSATRSSSILNSAAFTSADAFCFIFN